MNTQKSRNILAGGLLALAMALAGCMTSPTVSPPAITTQPVSLTDTVGGAVAFEVAASGTGLSYQWMQGSTALSGATASTLTLPSIPLSAGGSYSCVVANSAGSVTSDVATLTVEHTWPAEQTLVVGAQGNTTLATALDLDAPDTLYSASANANSANVDLLFVFANGAFELMSPLAASNAGLTIVQHYTTLNDVKFVQVSSKPLGQEDGEAAYNAGTPVDAMAVSAGETFIVKTSQNEYVYLEITSIVGSTSTGFGVLSVAVGTL